MAQASSGDLRTIASGLIPSGFDAASLTPEGRDEVRAAIDVILKLYDHQRGRLTLALEQLDRGALEIERLRKLIKAIGEYADGAMEGAAEPEFSVYDSIAAWCRDGLKV